LLLARLTFIRQNWNSAESQDRPRRPSYRRPERESRFSGGEDGLELGGASHASKDFTQSKSLHVSRLPAEITDEEFRDAFSGLKGLTGAELVFNSGALRDYKNTASRGFGFLHFEDESAAAAAAAEMESTPIRIRGFAPEINPSKAKQRQVNEESHVLHISGVPLDCQYLEISTLLKEKCPGFKSVRLMTGKHKNFLGAIGIAFKDTESAIKAKEVLKGVSLGGADLLEHNVAFGRPLWDKGEPTSTLLLIGTPRDPDGAYAVSEMLESLPGVDRHKVLQDRDTGNFKGTTIVNCKDAHTAWQTLDYLNRETPEYRVAFVTDRPAFQQRPEGQERDQFSRPSAFKSAFHDRGSDRNPDFGRDRNPDFNRNRNRDRPPARDFNRNPSWKRDRDQDY